MKKIIIATLSILILLGAVYVGYTKYVDYQVNQGIKEIVNVQDKQEEKKVINAYRSLLVKYNNNSKIYSSLSRYYLSKDRLDKAVEVLYLGLDTNKNNKSLIEMLKQTLKNASLQDGYLRVDKGSSITENSTIPVKINRGSNISLKLDMNNNKVNTSEVGFKEVQAKEKYTGINVTVGIEVLEAVGNTMGNNLLGGEMAYKNGWIYYRDPSSKALYKMKEDLSNKTQLDGSVDASYINIIGNNIFFIDSKSGQYGSLIKTDLNGQNKEIIRKNTNYVYIVGENIYYSEVTGEHNGWNIVSLNKMNFKYEDLEKAIETDMGFVRVINDKYICGTNKFGSFISLQKSKPTWGDSNRYKYLGSAEVYKGELYGNISAAQTEKTGFGKLDIQNNTQNVTIEDVNSFNCIGKDVYYINEDGIFTASVDGLNPVKLMDIDGEPNDTSLYNLGNKMYVYSSEIKLVEKNQEKAAQQNIPDIKNEDIIALCNNANKLILDVSDKRNSDQFKSNNFFYAGLNEPYSSKEKIRTAFSQYFTKQYIDKFMGGETFIERDGKLYIAVGDSGIGASYTYTSIKTRENKGSAIHATSYAKYSFDDSSAQDGEVKLKLEDGKWKINSFHGPY